MATDLRHARPAPLPCENCGGEGTIRDNDYAYRSFRSDCPVCRGTGVQRCRECGLTEAVVVHPDLREICGDCEEAMQDAEAAGDRG